jgi:hypothetical protein
MHLLSVMHAYPVVEIFFFHYACLVMCIRQHDFVRTDLL